MKHSRSLHKAKATEWLSTSSTDRLRNDPYFVALHLDAAEEECARTAKMKVDSKAFLSEEAGFRIVWPNYRRRGIACGEYGVISIPLRVSASSEVKAFNFLFLGESA